MKRAGKNPERGDIMSGGSCVDSFMWRIAGRRSFPNTHEINSKNWEETRLKKEKSHVMVTFKGRFKGETGDKWHMLISVDIKYSVIELIRCIYLYCVWWNINSSGMLK